MTKRIIFFALCAAVWIGGAALTTGCRTLPSIVDSIPSPAEVGQAVAVEMGVATQGDLENVQGEFHAFRDGVDSSLAEGKQANEALRDGIAKAREVESPIGGSVLGIEGGLGFLVDIVLVLLGVKGLRPGARGIVNLGKAVKRGTTGTPPAAP